MSVNDTRTNALEIDIYADVVCPWCYVGEAHLERALAMRPDLNVTLRWRPFQLRPEMPAGGEPWRAFAEEKFGGWARAQGAFAHVAEVGARTGLDFNFDKVASAPNTVDAHRLILLAAEFDKEMETAKALFKAYFSEGRDLNSPEDLVAVATRVGLKEDAVRAFLGSDALSAEVWASQERAQRLGISSVPFYVLNNQYGVSGAQPPELFLQAFDTIKTDSRNAAQHEDERESEKVGL